MPHLLTSSLCSAVLAVFVCLPAHAQTPAKGNQKTIAGKAASGKVMSKDELRACFARRDALNDNAKKIDADRVKLDAERVEILKDGEAIKAEREAIDKRLASVREWEGRVKSHASAIEAFNKRMAEINNAPADRRKAMEADLDVERGQIDKVTAQLRVDEAERVPAYQAAVKNYNDRAAARDGKVASWNDRNAASVKATDDHQEARLVWASECANRPYREDDEIAIKAGK